MRGLMAHTLRIQLSRGFVRLWRLAATEDEQHFTIDDIDELIVELRRIQGGLLREDDDGTV